MTDDFRYPTARRVVMAQCPSGEGSHPFFGRGPSQSATRMTALCPGWEDLALGANCWWTGYDQVCGHPSKAFQIIEETGCQTIVALGVFVQRELGLSPKGAELFGREIIEHLGRDILVVRFPHPSGRNRFWNSGLNCGRAANVLREVLE